LPISEWNVSIRVVSIRYSSCVVALLVLCNLPKCAFCSLFVNITSIEQEAQLSLTNHAMLFCKVVEVLQDVLSENVDEKFTTQVPNYYSAVDTIILLRFYN